MMSKFKQYRARIQDDLDELGQGLVLGETYYKMIEEKILKTLSKQNGVMITEEEISRKSKIDIDNVRFCLFCLMIDDKIKRGYEEGTLIAYYTIL